MPFNTQDLVQLRDVKNAEKKINKKLIDWVEIYFSLLIIKVACGSNIELKTG